ncbi:MAG: hypothetical protein IPK53_11095 [bacterium]|nr:hypothetical protein [bacterium]
MRRQRKLTPAQRRVLRQIVVDADDVMAGGYGFYARRTGYRSERSIRRKLTRRGYAVHEFRRVGNNMHLLTIWPTPKGLVALATR